MMPRHIEQFSEVWLCDFEFSAPPGERPVPICLVAQELRSGRLTRLWQDELVARREAPFPVDRDTLMVAFYASAEIGCFLALGWPLPVYILDLYAEFRNATNGLRLPCGRGLLGALTVYGLDSIGSEEKADMRALALRGGPWTAEEQRALLTYCQGDVDGLLRLLPCMLPEIVFPYALVRGRYMKAVARIEDVGVPIDVPTWRALMEYWPAIQRALIRQGDTAAIYEDTTFKSAKWSRWVEENGWDWPRLESGALSL